MNSAAQGVLGLPKVETLDTCAFPIVEAGMVGKHKVLRLPDELRALFAGGVHMVRINSLEIAHTIPDYKGKTSGENHSLLPHQDHLNPEGDKRQFLVLTKKIGGARGSSTIVMTPAVAAQAIPIEEAWIRDPARCALLGRERRYDQRFIISKKRYNACFDARDGYEKAVAFLKLVGAGTPNEQAIRLGLLGYLMRGPQADVVMAEVIEATQGLFFEETWERGGVLIVNNRAVFHGRLGGNTIPLQRNYFL